MRIHTTGKHVNLSGITQALWTTVLQCSEIWKKHGMQTLRISGSGPTSAQEGTAMAKNNALAIFTKSIPDEFDMAQEIAAILPDGIIMSRHYGYWILEDTKPC